MKNTKTRRVALTGMLFALALVLGFFESTFTPLLGLPPGVKIGLANVVVMFALLFLSRKDALLLVVLKAAFAFISRGGMAGLLSLAGGLLSLLVMVLLLLPKHKPSLLVLSVCSSLFHNLGQFVVFRLYMNSGVYAYLPVLFISGIIMGVLTALCLRALLPALKKTGITSKDYPLGKP